eukprot:TRINITY_DN4659_c0_g1_i1.p1 TRINITY_DN4659_c0_g1~~TRINITY_DN4659_c0_g1_i1.p1  ORF type:complete len:462 (-),score=74.01 TRINITY_DN4659_c0_g1_i1:168-1553(-)
MGCGASNEPVVSSDDRRAPDTQKSPVKTDADDLTLEGLSTRDLNDPRAQSPKSEPPSKAPSKSPSTTGDASEVQAPPPPSVSAPLAPPVAPKPGDKRTGFVYDDAMKLHSPEPKTHPENPERLSRIHSELTDQGLLDRCLHVPSRTATADELLLAHTPEQLALVAKADTQDPADKLTADTGTYHNAHTHHAALLATGSLLQLLERLYAGDIDNGFALIRPPGHHAEHDKVMGFCFFNNVAVAAAVARASHSAKKVLIIDWDVHHGNGTQNIFDSDPNVLYFSVHRFDGGKFFPGTGAMTNVGTGAGEGFSVNVPWNARRLGDAEYMATFEQILLPVAAEFGPDLVLVSAGFDCIRGDPLGQMEVTPEGAGHMMELALRCAPNGKVLVALEGGYNLSSISHSSAACIRVLLGENAPDYGAFDAHIVVLERTPSTHMRTLQLCNPLLRRVFLTFSVFGRRASW